MFFFDEDNVMPGGLGENLHQQIMSGEEIYGNLIRREAAEFWEWQGVSEEDQFDGEFMRCFAEVRQDKAPIFAKRLRNRS